MELIYYQSTGATRLLHENINNFSQIFLVGDSREVFWFRSYLKMIFLLLTSVDFINSDDIIKAQSI